MSALALMYFYLLIDSFGDFIENEAEYSKNTKE
ncbi:Putative protein [Zobellia galactanivorans]|uniref:Uncharacterized protein n=1 Tax=Zobellia galactanivorans (strain DSM 12802 / CCUG 47099 / CIP 106680 / NCIMB 13871 / Dsij) TaxID=63186 RepID=G0LAA9_ZOBGA|nr:Putative protein [Zobellia galactanivorans]